MWSLLVKSGMLRHAELIALVSTTFKRRILGSTLAVLFFDVHLCVVNAKLQNSNN